MNREEKTAYNRENESNYYYAPFTPQRAELRKEWGTTRKCWESFLYQAEKKMIFKKLDNKKGWIVCQFDPKKRQVPLYDKIDGEMKQTAIGLY